jgi:hypothetical protein
VTCRDPDGPGVVRATCADRAGNGATRDFPLRYDASPPALAVRSAAGHRMAIVRWRASPDARSFRLVRWIHGAPWTRTVVYRGRRHRYVDRTLVDGRPYRYAVVARDRAGHRTVRRVRVRPRRALLAPRRGARTSTPPLLRWTPVLGARYYHVQLLRAGETILRSWPTRPRYRIPTTWSFGGQTTSLTPGAYTWYVWPGFGRRTRHRYGPPIGHRRFVVVAPA